MTIPYMIGFDDVYEDSDLRSQGFVHGTAITGNGFALGMPSQNGRPGRCLRANPTSVVTTGTPGDGGMDTGVFNTGYTARQLWTAGGFSLAALLKFNAEVRNLLTQGLGVGAAVTGNMQVCHDGVRLWAIRAINSVSQAAPNAISYSEDGGATWVDVLTAPGGGTPNWANYGIWALAAGQVILHIGINNNSAVAASNIGYRYTLSTSTWDSFVTATSFQGGCSGGYTYNPNDASFPYLAAYHGSLTANTGAIYAIPPGGGTPTRIVQTAQSSTTTRWTMCKYVNGRLLATTNTSPSILWSSTTPSVTGSYTSLSMTMPVGGSITVSDMTYFNGAWLLISSTNGGIWRCTTADPTAAAANWTRVQTTSSALYSIAASGSQVVAVGNGGTMYISSDGITWTNLSTARINYANTLNKNVLYDPTGARFIAVLGSQCVVATSPDGNNWTPTFVPEILGSTTVNQTQMFGLYFATSASWNGSTGAFTQASANGLYARVDLLASNARPVGLATATNSTPQTLPSISVSQATTQWHHVELQATATVNPNEFTVSMTIDGGNSVTAPSPVVLGANSGDTTALAIINLMGRNMMVNGIDDLVFQVNGGATNATGPIGVCRIVPLRPNSDVQAQFTRLGGAASNALSTAQPAYSQQDGNSVQSTTTGNKDIYGLSSTTILGLVKALKVSAYVSAADASASKINLGIRSGTTENLGSDVTVTSATPIFASQIYEVNPATGSDWSSVTAVTSNPVLRNNSNSVSPSLSLTHFDGTNGQTTGITDSSADAKVWVPNGSASAYGSLNTAVAKFGTAGLRFGGSGSGFWSLTNANYPMGGGVFTLECWFRNISMSVGYNPIFGFVCKTDTYGGLYVCTNGVIGSTTGSSWTILGASISGTGGVNIMDGLYHHLAIVRDASSNIIVYTDGIAQSTTSQPGTFTGDMTTLMVGSGNGSTSGTFDIDELRYNKSVIYTGPFTPPTGPFP